ncbi:MAG: WYL domain-containing protein, partial [Clostridiales bacterium]|nr:WYL domain-containing protein [Clostridiales bacterium]
MAEFNELIRDFKKIRDYMRDFYVYGFKSRNDFKHKSARTYDNEKRRIESYMGGYMKWNYTKSGKNSCIAMDCAKIAVNPLYAAWQSKAFTGNDIMLHFYILDALKNADALPIEALTDEICAQSGETFDAQTVRHKCAEYVSLGLLISEKKGRALYYRLSPCFFDLLTAVAPGLPEAVKFFQGAAPFGEIGSFLMDNVGIENDRFSFKHYYVAHTLEDGILLELLAAIRKNQEISFVNYSEKTDWVTERSGIPMKIFVSAATGRRYLCL